MHDIINILLGAINMKLKNSFFYTMREDAKDEESRSGNLLTRAGMIKKTSNGVYMTMPLGKRVVQKIEQIIREEMNQTGAQELHMPSLILEEIYETSGRRGIFGSNMFSLKDRYQKNYVLGPTHEELFALAGTMHGASYKDFPYNLYQFQTKFRDETRPRFGLIRTREFTMKDAYSYDIDLAGLDVSYQKMFQAYQKSFDRMGMKYKIVKADTGAMGGLLSEEFQAITPIGEDTVVSCSHCGFASNLEITPVVLPSIPEKDVALELKMVPTPGAKTIEEVAHFFGKDVTQFVKTLIYKIDGTLVAFLLRGDRELNDTKVMKALGVLEVELASFEEVKNITHAEVGFAGPIGLSLPIYMDQEVASMQNFICGANVTDTHYINGNIKDITVTKTFDFGEVREGDVCPNCNELLSFDSAIEVGNTFKLGTKYAEVMGLKYLNQENQLCPVVMGSYGIGLERCMAAIVEQNNDSFGIQWPFHVAPYHIAIVVISNKDETQVNEANKLYEALTELGYDVLLDDREERPGVKFKDMDLIGIPIRITVGKRITEGMVEIKHRKDETSMDILLPNIVEEIKKLETK